MSGGEGSGPCGGGSTGVPGVKFIPGPGPEGGVTTVQRVTQPARHHLHNFDSIVLVMALTLLSYVQTFLILQSERERESIWPHPATILPPSR